jgi:hypothetical protein
MSNNADDNEVTSLDDGFGNVWEKCERPDCGLQIVRPGSAQCDTCDNDDDDEGAAAWRLLADADDEIERLRVAGEDLAEALRDTRRRHQCDCADRYDERTGDLALAQWEKARRD